MAKIKIFIISILIFSLLPLVSFAQFDFFDDFITDYFDDDFDIVINSVELLWSTNTYTPYNYQGRKLPSPGSEITIEAIVNTSNGNPIDLKYSWFLDNVFQRSKSDYGKTTFSFNAIKTPGASHVVKVQIFNEDRSAFREKSIEVPIISPELVVYSSDGSTYFSDQASGLVFVTTDKQSSFIGKPYFFSIKKITDLIFEWQFADQEPIISSAYDANVLDLTISEKEDEEILERNLWISVNNKIKPQQKAFQTIKINIY